MNQFPGAPTDPIPQLPNDEGVHRLWIDAAVAAIRNGSAATTATYQADRIVALYLERCK